MRASAVHLLATLLLLSCGTWPRSGARRGGGGGGASAAAAAAAPAAPPGADVPLVCVVVRTFWGHGSYGDNSLPNLLWSLAKQTHPRCGGGARSGGGPHSPRAALRAARVGATRRPRPARPAPLPSPPLRWVALLLVMDNRPFPDLRHIVRHNADARVRVFAEWVRARGRCRRAGGHGQPQSTSLGGTGSAAKPTAPPLHPPQISAAHAPKSADGKDWAPGYHSALYRLTDKAVRGERAGGGCPTLP
jgi:hypothetical protein